jgi:hypothetical protein
MRYLLLCRHNEEAFERLSETEQEGMLQEAVAVVHELRSKGQCLDSAPLHPTSTATTVRVRNGKRLVTDGPFAETREQLGGYFLIEAQGLEQAREIAARLPGARIGTIEIRPVLEIPGLPGR